MTSLASQKRRPFTADFIEEAGKNQLKPGSDSMGEVPVLSHRYLLRNF